VRGAGHPLATIAMTTICTILALLLFPVLFLL
jgi:hypothetical protein